MDGGAGHPKGGRGAQRRRRRRSLRRRLRPRRAARAREQRHRPRHPRPAGTSCGAARPRRHREPHRPARDRTRHGHRARRRQAPRDHHAQARRAHRRPPCRGRLHRRLARGRGPPRFFLQRHEHDARRHPARLFRRAGGPRGRPGALRRRPGAAYRRGPPATAPLLPLFRLVRRRAKRTRRRSLPAGRRTHDPPRSRANGCKARC